MNKDKYVFAQLTEHLDYFRFRRLVRKYQGDSYVKHFSCWHQFLTLMFGQLSGRESLRDLVTVLEAHHSKCYHLGLGDRPVSRNAISLANLPRDSASSRSLFPHGGGGGRRLSFMAPLFFQASSRKSSFLSGFTGHLWGGIMKTDGICPGMGRVGHGLLPPGSQVPPGARRSGLKGNSPSPAFPSPPSLDLGITLLASP